jgi:hypothetical protein
MRRLQDLVAILRQFLPLKVAGSVDVQGPVTIQESITIIVAHVGICVHLGGILKLLNFNALPVKFLKHLAITLLFSPQMHEHKRIFHLKLW